MERLDRNKQSSHVQTSAIRTKPRTSYQLWKWLCAFHAIMLLWSQRAQLGPNYFGFCHIRYCAPRSNLLGPLISYKENEVLVICPLEPYSVQHFISLITHNWAHWASVCHWQTTQAWCNIMLQVIRPICKLQWKSSVVNMTPGAAFTNGPNKLDCVSLASLPSII